MTMIHTKCCAFVGRKTFQIDRVRQPLAIVKQVLEDLGLLNIHQADVRTTSSHADLIPPMLLHPRYVFLAFYEHMGEIFGVDRTLADSTPTQF